MRDEIWEGFLREWNPIEQRVRVLDAALWRRANDLAYGLGTGRNVWSNAMLSLDDGRPWPTVDYSRLRHALWVDGPLRDRLRAIEARLRRACYARHYPERAPLGPHRSESLRVDVSPMWTETFDADYM